MTKYVFLLALGLAFIASAVALNQPPHAAALAPCVNRSLTAEEQAFVGQVQSWRDSNIPGSRPLTTSNALNAAALGYAQFLANTPGAGGHHADGGGQFAWAERAEACGYPSNSAAGGEGLAVVEGSGQVSVDGAMAISIMSAHLGSGIWVPASVGIPVECVGVGKAVSPSGNKVAWVVLLFGSRGSCAFGQEPIPTTPTTSTATSSPTMTATPTRTPSPTPTPPPPPVVLPAIARD